MSKYPAAEAVLDKLRKVQVSEAAHLAKEMYKEAEEETEFQFYIPKEGGEIKMRKEKTSATFENAKQYEEDAMRLKDPENDSKVGVKYDSKKLRMDLIPPEVEEALAIVLTYGCTKYGDRNWEKGIAYSRIYGALRRHLLKWVMGHRRDEESGLPTLWHALCCIAFLVTYESRDMGGLWDNLCETSSPTI